METKHNSWLSKEDVTLASFLSSSVQLPESEATELASQIQGQWRDDWLARGGREDRSHRRRARLGLLIGIGLIVLFLLAVVGVVLIVWAVVT